MKKELTILILFVLGGATNLIAQPKGLDPNSFETVATNHFPKCQNFHIYLKSSMPLEALSLQSFVDLFRKRYCTIQCNIYLYDQKLPTLLYTKYPLSDKEYLIVADHLVASSNFDVSEIWMYPQQDWHYKELGGKNWKKEQ